MVCASATGAAEQHGRHKGDQHLLNTSGESLLELKPNPISPGSRCGGLLALNAVP
jgi:hypothetical protein